MKTFLLFLCVTLSLSIFSQKDPQPANNYQKEFANAYNQYPDVPKGMLEAVSFTMTRFRHIENEHQGCAGLPLVYGVMGLTLDGQNYFRNNLNYIAQVSEISVNDILQSPQQNILAFAAAYQHQLTLLNPSKYQSENIAHFLANLSELPSNGLMQDFALNSHLFAVLSFMNDTKMQQAYNFPHYNLNLEAVFGKENLKVLQSTNVTIDNEHVEGDNGIVYKTSTINNKSADYPPALSSITPCNFSSRGTAITAVTIHTIQGSYAGAISWANNCSSNVSYHYVLRSSDGQVTQVVLESNKAWHVGSENPYTIGLEHEGWVNDSAWYTAAMYQSSADLVRDITQSGYGISPLRTAYFPWAPTTFYNASGIPGSCVTIKGHMHFPNQSHTDPGSNWDWKYYDNLINNTTAVTTITSNSGVITDNGGSAGNYTGERDLILIQPTAAATITLTTVAFNLENTWDYLYIYDGNSTFSSLIGYYTGTTIPATISSTGGSMLLELRSDCATNALGFEFNFNSSVPDLIKPTTAISSSPSPNTTTDFVSNFTDADNVGGSGVMHQFYQVADFNTTEWRANDNNGFFNDDFDVAIHPDWIDSSGVWNIVGAKLNQNDQVNSNTNIYAALDQNNSNKYLYHYKATISGTGANKRAGFHYMSDDASQTNRGNSYFTWFRQDNGKLQFYKVVNNTFTLEKDVVYNFNTGQEYDYKIVYDKTTGITEVYVDDVFIDFWQDPTPITLGNFISFRSADCAYDVDDLKAYKSRTASETITVGPSPTNDIRYENNPTTSGRIHSIVIDAANNISIMATEMVDVDFLITAINDISKENLSVYPNPFIDDITLTLNTANQVNIILFDVHGKIVVNQNSTPKNKQIQLDLIKYKLNSGLYLLKVTGENTTQTIRLIKQ
jgi:N-acetyl-anhydromuramyl-L-alanine amidase AmpD